MPPSSTTAEPTDVDQQCPEQVEEYTDDQGRRIRRVVKKTVIRTTGPGTFTHDQREQSDEPEERVEEYTDDQGRKVRRITRRVVRHRRVEKEVEPERVSGLESQPFKLQMKPKSVSRGHGGSPGDVDEHGRKVHRVVKKTLSPFILPERKGEDVSEKTEEYIDKEGRKVTRVFRRKVVRSREVPDEEKV